MFRTKQSVDRHVQGVFRKLNENEVTLRSYNVARLYFQVQDYETAKIYVSRYLDVKSDQSGPHKLLGEIYEALGQKESALAQYKQSLEIEPRQDNLVLKVCELLADTDVGLDVNRVKYWVHRADEIFPHNPTVFQLKEMLLTIDRPSNGGEDLEALIAAELTARPSDVQLRVKLLKYYIDKSRLDDAYEHALKVESTYAHRDSVAWYEALCDLLNKCKELKQSQWTFWILYVSSLERFAALCLKDQGHILKKTIDEAEQAVFRFDQVLTDENLQNFPNTATFAKHMLSHMWGQLHYHLACLLLRKTKRNQGSWSDAGRLCAPLLLTAMHVAPLDIQAPWAIDLKNEAKSQIELWYREGSYRCSQAGHVLQDYVKNDNERFRDKIQKFGTGKWRQRIYQRIFGSKALVTKSYFATHSANEPPLRLFFDTELKLYDKVAEEVWPASLHHYVWLGILSKQRSNRGSNSDEIGPQPQQHCHIFPDLQLSVLNLNQGAPDTLGQLDIDAFLNAAVLCASMVVEEQQRFMDPDRFPMPTLPADITNTLCTCTQDKWWSSAYKIYRKQDGISGDLGEIRQELQRGLEVVRCIGNHGLHPAILVHLARIFHHRAKMLKEKDKNHSELEFVEARCELYWSAVVPLLERLLNNQTIRTTNSKMFDYQGKEMNNVELTNALEEGRLLLAQRYIREKQHEQAIEALQALKCPEASFMQGEIYKSLADELMSTLPKENLTSAMRSQHVTTLAKARSCYYLTLDRLRSPGANPKHPLNAELGTRIADIENDLKRIDPDLWRSDSNRHDCDALSDADSYSSAHSGDAPVIQNSYTSLMNTIPIGTPLRNSSHRKPKQASTPCRPQHQDILELTRKSTQHEARPSPERLDAQLRQLLHSNDGLLQSILEQNRALLESNKSIIESNKSMNTKIEELQKQFADLRKDSQQSKSHQQSQNRGGSTSASRNPLDVEDLYVLSDDDYRDLNYSSSQTVQQPQIPSNLFAQPQRNPYTPLVYPQAQTIPYYPTMPYNDPHTQHMTSMYPPSVFQVPALYPRPPIDAMSQMPKMPDNMQGMFTQCLMNQLNDQQQQTMPIQAPQLSMQLQNLDLTRNEVPAKDIQPLAAVNRTPPVNVVITTSDTLPTNVPTVQPLLSVTIPPQHRAPSFANNLPQATAAPHSYQMTMPLQATIPTTVILPPLSATITNTISASVAEQARINIQNGSIMSTGSYHNNSNDGPEIEHDPLPDFVPVIPLPAEVKVTTGEEDEDTLFCARAKLYRWSDKEWKERGVGNVKLLRNNDGKVRLVMRREQVLKICANHMLSPEMELGPMTNNDRAWIWVANDFADEQVRLEKLCIKFKHVEEAVAFKEAFDKAKNSIVVTPIKSKPDTIEKNTSSSITLGGFSFTSKPIVQKTASPEPLKITKPEETGKPSPFAGFSFTKTPVEPTVAPFSFVKSSTTPNSQEISTSETSRTSLRRPHAPAHVHIAAAAAAAAAAAGATNVTEEPEISGNMNEDGEAVIYDNKANIMRCNVNSTQWKNRGVGTLKILLSPKTGKIRLFIIRDDTQKVFYNQSISPTTDFSNLSGTDNVITWISQDSTKGVVKSEKIAVVFDSSSIATYFNNIVNTIQRKIVDNRIPVNAIRQEGKKIRLVDAKTTKQPEKTLAEMFKPASGSWECNSCYTRNESTASKCLACETPAPGAPKPQQNQQFVAASAPEKAPLWTQFKPQPESWECKSCYIRNTKENTYCVACDTAKDPSMPSKPKSTGFNLNSNPPTSNFNFGIPPSTPVATNLSLAEMFKPQQGSWECNGCLVRNNENVLHCAACDTPKDSTIAPKQKTGIFGNIVGNSASTPTFSFGIPSKEVPTSGFTFKMPSADDKASGDSIFGNSFGTTQASTTPPNVDSTSGFAFGSPGKSFDFQFPSVKSPIKSPRQDPDDDEVAESEDVYFAPVIPLPDKVDVKTGEEDEEIVYSHRAKLFRFDANNKEWKERGLGDIKLLRNNQTKKLRMVMRRDQTLKLCLNHFVTVELEIKSKDEKTWLWTAADYSEGDIECLQLACRFKTSEIAGDFKRAVDEATEKLRTSSNDDKTENFSTPSIATKPSLQDIEVIYEMKVTPEEKLAALKLQLPENFYAYKQKKSCSGCIGCREPEVSLFDGPKVEKSMETKLLTPKIAPPKFTSPTSVTTQATKSLFSAESTEKSTINFTNVSSLATSNITEDASKTTEKKPTGFVFNPSVAGNQEKNKLFDGLATNFGSKSFTPENLTICSPTQQNTTGNTATQQPFGRMQSSFGSTNFGSAGQTSIFGSTQNTGNSIFGGNAIVKTQEDKTPEIATPTQSFPNIFGGAAKTTISSPATNLFGGNAIVKTQEDKTPEIATPTQSFSNIFGGAAKTTVSSPATNLFGAAPQPNYGFGGISSTNPTPPATNVFGNSSATPIFGSNSTNLFGGANQTTPKLNFGTIAGNNTSGNGNASDNSVDSKIDDKKGDGINFLPVDNTATFSDLAAQSPQQPSFTKDPNFSFAGAGTSVFGSRTSTSSSANNSRISAKATPKKDGKEDEAEDANEEEEGQEYDPQFEPIIPLPDAIEVRTGEEDEQKVFCHRAKLYRYESDTKEWKERGTGEMKLLYHAEHGSYRLLLRREQVHKVVCNQLVTQDLELRTLQSSDRAWMWAGINHAEEPYAIEELAVKFKNPELALQFKDAVEKAKNEIVNRQATSIARTDDSATDIYEHEDDGDEDEDEDDEEVEEPSIMFAGRAELFTTQGINWISLGSGYLKVLYDSEIYGAKIIMEVDYTGEIASNTVISMETTMERNDKSCVWTAIDEVINPPTRRTLKAVFDDDQVAQNMFINFQDGQEYAKQADISDVYYESSIQ